VRLHADDRAGEPAAVDDLTSGERPEEGGPVDPGDGL
jgi:hypothetical protein